MTFPWPEERKELRAYFNERLAASDVVVIGPGLGQSNAVTTLVNDIVCSQSIPVVVDADGLNVLECSSNTFRGHAGPRVLTPHPGEFARLLGISTAEVQERREELTIDFAQRFGVVLVLKGHETLVCDVTRIYRNNSGNPGMATAGSGDVLAGLIGALIGQGLAPFEAAQLGVFVHGRAGDLARDHFGEVSLIASDLLDYLPMAFQSIQDGRPKEGL
jgi:NAD(P)H-hydrate epimerase